MKDGRAVSDGPLWFYDFGSGVKGFIKCLECFEKDPVLRNYQPTEVYSRIVGYLRPVKQWNDGKKAEFKHRINFKVNE